MPRPEFDQTLIDALSQEQVILLDLREKTGLDFKKLGGIDSCNATATHAVLPILVSWIPKAVPNIRAAIFSCFVTPVAKAYFDRLFLEWEHENEKIEQQILTRFIAINVDDRSAGRVWEKLKEKGRDAWDTELLAALAKCPSVAAEVRELALILLNGGKCNYSDLDHISNILDRRVSAWFAERIDSEDPQVRRIAKRLFKKHLRLPKGLETIHMTPADASAEVFSAELDLADLGRFLAEMTKTRGIKLPSALLKPGTFETVDCGIYFRYVCSSEFNLWFQLEDVDTMRVVLTKRPRGVQ